MSTLSPNMSLTLPTIGVDSGLVWEQSFNSDMNILDGHNHSVGSGVQINVSGVNFTSDLPLNGNNLTLVRSTRYSVQVSPLSGAADLGCVYVSGVDLYYNDINGNQIQITAGGSVNATSSGISSGTATASFSSSTLVVNAASNTPANIQGASILLGNTGVSGSKYLTLSPPSALSANYSLTLPQIPAQTNVMTLDTSGNMSSTTWDQVGINMTSTGVNAIATTMGSTGAGIIFANHLRPVTGSGGTAGVGGIAVSNSTGTFSTTSGSFQLVVSCTLTTVGKSVQLFLTSDGSSGFLTTGSFFDITGGTPTASMLIQNATTNAFYQGYLQGTVTRLDTNWVDTSVAGSAGTYTYNLYVKCVSASGIGVIAAQLMAYEIQ